MPEYFIQQPDKEITPDELHDMICTSNKTIMSVHLLMCIIGMLNSGTNAFVLTRKNMLTHPLNILLAGLQCCNVIFLATYLPSLIFNITCPVYLFETWVVIFFAVLSDMPRALVIFTNWMTCCVAGWRFAAVTWPLKTRAILTGRIAAMLIPSVGCLSLVNSFYLFFGLKTNTVDLRIHDPQRNVSYSINIYNRTTDTLGSLHTYPFNREAFIAIHFLGYLIPSVCTVICNLGLIANVSMKTLARQKLVEGQASKAVSSERRMTIILVVMLLANVFCYVSPGLFILKKALCTENCGPSMPGHWHDIFDDYRAVLFLNCFEFCGFYLMSVNFRETFHKLVNRVKTTPKQVCRDKR